MLPVIYVLVAGLVTILARCTFQFSRGVPVSPFAPLCSSSGRQIQFGPAFNAVVFVGALSAACVLALAGTALASSLPTAVTGPASGLSYTSATVSGNVSPNGALSKWYFEYGTTTGYGLKTALVSAGSGSAGIPVSSPLSGLVPGVRYYYRLVASSAVGSGVGDAASFVTPKSSPTVVLESSSGTSDSTTVLNATIDAHGLSTVWYYNFGPTSTYGARSATQNVGSATVPAAVKVTLSGLHSATLYHYQVVATNAAGTQTSADATFFTHGAPSAENRAPTSLESTTATLSGSVNPDGHPTTWYFQYGTSTTYSLKTAAHSAGSGVLPVFVALGVSGLSPQTTYHFRLVASNDVGTDITPDATFATPGPTLTASTKTLVYGHVLLLSGSIPTRAANQSVTLFSQSYTGGSFTSMATILTGPGGLWSYTTKPSYQTSYMAEWSSTATATQVVAVSPAVSLRVVGSRFATHVASARSVAHRVAQLERLVKGRWVTIARQALGRGASAVFAPKLSRGAAHLRVAFAGNQAGPGYVTGYSYVLVDANR